MGQNKYAPRLRSQFIGSDRRRYLVLYKTFMWENKPRVEWSLYTDVSEAQSPKGSYTKRASGNVPLLNNSACMTAHAAVENYKKDHADLADLGPMGVPVVDIHSELGGLIRHEFIAT